MLYTGLHRKVNRVGRLVRRSLLIVTLLVVMFVPTIANAEGGGRYSNCRGGDSDFSTHSHPYNEVDYHYCMPD
jgi:hypothetical protein